jgi:hypothetical protein
MNKTKFSLLAAISVATAFTFSMLALAGCAPKLSPQELSYSETVDVPEMEKNELFMKISLWSSDAFKGPDNTPFEVPQKSKVLSANSEQSLVVANHTNTIQIRGGDVIFFVLVYSKVTIAADNGGYKIKFEVSNVQHTFNSGGDGWGYSKVYEPSMVAAGLYKNANALNLTKAAWREFADALRSTTSGTVVGN